MDRIYQTTPRDPCGLWTCKTDSSDTGDYWVSDDPEQWRALKESIDHARMRTAAPRSRREPRTALTPREREIAELVRKPNYVIARMLGISRQTVKNHLVKIFDVLGVSNRAELIERMKT